MLGFFSVYERLFSHFVKILLDELNELQLQLTQKKMLVKKISATNWPENRSPIPSTDCQLFGLGYALPIVIQFYASRIHHSSHLSELNFCGRDKLYSEALFIDHVVNEQVFTERNVIVRLSLTMIFNFHFGHLVKKLIKPKSDFYRKTDVAQPSRCVSKLHSPSQLGPWRSMNY
jgi:hypothetical protein